MLTNTKCSAHTLSEVCSSRSDLISVAGWLKRNRHLFATDFTLHTTVTNLLHLYEFSPDVYGNANTISTDERAVTVPPSVQISVARVDQVALILPILPIGSVLTGLVPSVAVYLNRVHCDVVDMEYNEILRP